MFIKFCQDCGILLPHDTEFCPSCGFKNECMPTRYIPVNSDKSSIGFCSKDYPGYFENDIRETEVKYGKRDKTI